MDGHFVPNLSIGAPVVACLRPRTDLYLDCHLMIDNPGDLLDDFAKAGADSCTVHVELGDPRPLFDRMRARTACASGSCTIRRLRSTRWCPTSRRSTSSSS